MHSKRTSLHLLPRKPVSPLSASTANRLFGLLLVFLFVLAVLTFLSMKAWGEAPTPAAPTVSVAPTVGPPTSKVLVSGRGFDPYAAVDIYFDLTDLALVVTDGKGTFGVASGLGGSGIPIVVPKNAVPGTHWITAVERYGIKAAQQPFLVRTDWAQFHFSPDHKGLNPYENILNPDTVANLTPLWMFTPGDSSPAVFNGVVYIVSDAAYALNASTGALLWTYPVSGYGPTVSNGMVYIGAGDHYVYALNAATGALVWKYATDGTAAGTPTVANGVVYVGTAHGLEYSYMYALNARTGAFIWKSQGYDWCASSPAVAGGAVYVSVQEKTYGHVDAWDAATGAFLWRALSPDSIASSPAVANGLVYVGTVSGNSAVWALNAKTGEPVWSYHFAGCCFYSSPAVANGIVYIGFSDHNLYALDAETGKLLWTYATGGRVDSSPAVADGVVYVGSDDHYLYAVNASTGMLLWKYATGGAVRPSPAIANGMVYIGSGDDKLYAFGLPSEQMADKFSPPPPRPDPMMLSPDWSLQPYVVVTSTINNH